MKILEEYLTKDEANILLFLTICGLLGMIIHISGLQAETKVNAGDSLRAALKQNAAIVYDLNTVTLKELVTIPGIGQIKAEAIVQYRDANKPIMVDDLIRVKGIGEKTLQKIRVYFDDKATISSTTTTEETININDAAISDLMRVKGIGEVKAGNIVEHIKTNGRIKKIDQITAVKGIGSKTLENIKEYFHADDD